MISRKVSVDSVEAVAQERGCLQALQQAGRLREADEGEPDEGDAERRLDPARSASKSSTADRWTLRSASILRNLRAISSLIVGMSGRPSVIPLRSENRRRGSYGRTASPPDAVSCRCRSRAIARRAAPWQGYDRPANRAPAQPTWAPGNRRRCSGPPLPDGVSGRYR